MASAGYELNPQARGINHDVRGPLRGDWPGGGGPEYFGLHSAVAVVGNMIRPGVKQKRRRRQQRHRGENNPEIESKLEH